MIKGVTERNTIKEQKKEAEDLKTQGRRHINLIRIGYKNQLEKGF